MTSRQDFTDSYERGRRLYSRNFVLFINKRADSIWTWRLGLAVGRKIGSAVARNRVKRVLREFFRLHQHSLSQDADFVVVPKKHLKVSSVTLDMVSRELLELFRSSGFFKVSTSGS